MARPVRVRFAPSPTGPLHIGGVRTALYNYLFARKMGGTMILRIEDTDSQRFVPGAEEYILESLEWCGIRIDEGVGAGGPHAPYRQSERREIYLKYALQLVEAGWAYYAFDTAEELDALRREAEGRGEAFAYNYTVREKLATSLALPAEEVRARIDRGDQWVIRFRMPENEVVEMDDLIRGHVEVNTSTLDDKVLYKSSDALPTYHLANIVDDHLMEVSHVIRGEEWLPSLPLHYPAIQSIRMDGDAARVRPPAPAAQTHGRRQALETRRRQDGIPRIPALLEIPHDGRDRARIPRGRLFPRGIYQHAGAAGVEPRHRAGDFLDAGADRQFLAGTRFQVGRTLPARQGKMVQCTVHAP